MRQELSPNAVHCLQKQEKRQKQQASDLSHCIPALHPKQTVGDANTSASPPPHLLLSSSNSRCICARMVFSSA
jgi:hypothetical protein